MASAVRAGSTVAFRGPSGSIRRPRSSPGASPRRRCAPRALLSNPEALDAVAQQTFVFALTVAGEVGYNKLAEKLDDKGLYDTVVVPDGTVTAELAGAGALAAGAVAYGALRSTVVGLALAAPASAALIAVYFKRADDTPNDLVSFPGPRATPVGLMLLSFFCFCAQAQILAN